MNPAGILGPMRLPFVILTPACVMLGVSTAYAQTQNLDLLHVVITLVGALAAHISVNAINEYFDFKSGLDFKTKRTPFSGGSGALPAGQGSAATALATSVISLVITAAAGIYFLYVRGWMLLPLGVAGLVVIVAYTVLFTRNPFLSLISPGLGFGTLMVMGTHFALTGTYTLPAFSASLVPFFLVNDLLLLNQFPDIEADRSIGRKHFPLLIGPKKSSIIYAAFLGLAYVSIVIAVVLGYFPLFSLLGLLTLALAVPAVRGAVQHGDNIEKLMPSLGQNVMINIATPVLVAIGLFIGK